jgi:hypothetical protein
VDRVPSLHPSLVNGVEQFFHDRPHFVESLLSHRSALDRGLQVVPSGANETTRSAASREFHAQEHRIAFQQGHLEGASATLRIVTSRHRPLHRGGCGRIQVGLDPGDVDLHERHFEEEAELRVPIFAHSVEETRNRIADHGGRSPSARIPWTDRSRRGKNGHQYRKKRNHITAL